MKMAKNIEKLRRSAYHQELGHKMCAAFVAQQQGIALNTALNKVSGPVGDLWSVVAEYARWACLEAADATELNEIVMERLPKLTM
jgi:muconolactone delta-isomerase